MAKVSTEPRGPLERPRLDRIEIARARLRCMLSDYEYLGTRATADLERYGYENRDYETARRLIMNDIENLLGRPVYDEPAMLPIHGPSVGDPDAAPF